MLRISTNKDAHQSVVSIAGRLEAQHLVGLGAECSDDEQTIMLELSELQSADE